ncbi:MAG: cation diffusion facilitator family transporter [Rubellimicrobium sp.]|nr:cation diffusion facilitator family transporter [Rubellimicrobium sp.]
MTGINIDITSRATTVRDQTGILRSKITVATFSLVTTMVLTFGKLLIGLMTGSLALIADGTQGLIDVIVTAVTIVFIISAARQACPTWTVGRQKLEVLAALIEAALLGIVAVCIWYLAAQKLLLGRSEVEVSDWQLGLVAVAIVLDYLRAMIVGRVARQTGSIALEANALHFRTDSIGSVVVLVGLLLCQAGWAGADTVATLVLAGFLTWTAFRIGLRATALLLDVSDPRDSLAVLEALLDNSAVCDVPVLRLYRRVEGHDVVAEVAVVRDLADAESLRKALERRVVEVLPEARALIALRPTDAGPETAQSQRG